MKELDLEELDKFDSVVFDLDGTLVNSMCFHIKAWQDVMKQYEIDVDYDWLYARGGVPSRYIAKELIEIHNLKDVDAYTLADKKADNYKSNIHKVEVYPRMYEVLEYLKKHNIPMAIGTGTLRSNADYIVANTELHKFIKVVITAEDVVNHKPHPETFVKACLEVSGTPSNSVVFEDTVLGVEASKNGGFATVFVKDGIPYML